MTRKLTMSDQTQQEFLRAAKATFGCTWDEMAARTGINPRALKTYRMPEESDDFRMMNSLAKNAIIRALEDCKKKSK